MTTFWTFPPGRVIRLRWFLLRHNHIDIIPRTLQIHFFRVDTPLLDPKNIFLEKTKLFPVFLLYIGHHIRYSTTSRNKGGYVHPYTVNIRDHQNIRFTHPFIKNAKSFKLKVWQVKKVLMLGKFCCFIWGFVTFIPFIWWGWNILYTFLVIISFRYRSLSLTSMCNLILGNSYQEESPESNMFLGQKCMGKWADNGNYLLVARILLSFLRFPSVGALTLHEVPKCT